MSIGSVSRDATLANARARGRSYNLEAARALRRVAEAARKEADRLEKAPESLPNVDEVNEGLAFASRCCVRAWALLTLDAAG